MVRSDKKHRKQHFIFCLAGLLFSLLFTAPPCRAGKTVISENGTKVINYPDNYKEIKMEKGVIVYTVEDKTSTSPIVFITKKFRLKNNWVPRTNPYVFDKQNIVVSKPYGEINLYSGNGLDSPYKESRVDANGKTYTTFTLPEKIVTKACEDAKITAATLKETGNHIYLNGEIQTYNKIPLGNDTYSYSVRNGGRYYSTLHDMMYAETWAKRDDFLDRFNIELPFGPKSYPVYIKRMIKDSKGNYTTHDYKKIGEYPVHSLFQTKSGTTVPKDASKITQEIAVRLLDGVTDKNNYFLCESWWSLRSDPKETHSNGTYRKRRNRYSWKKKLILVKRLISFIEEI